MTLAKRTSYSNFYNCISPDFFRLFRTKTESFLRIAFLFLGKLLTKNERKRGGNYFSSPLCLQSAVSKNSLLTDSSPANKLY